MNTKSKIVTSAADSCGQPSSIRSMDHLPSRDHKGAEYKESFMFSNRSSVSRGSALAIAALAAVACIGLAGTTTASTIIYQDTFTGSATAGTLNGATPNTVDTGGATWAAYTGSPGGWSDSGYSNSGTSSRLSASLPFTPVAGQIYTLSLGINVLQNFTNPSFQGFNNAGNYWGALGFMLNQNTSVGWDSGGTSPWLLSGMYAPTGGPNNGNNTNGAVWTGPGLVGGEGFGNPDITAGVNNYSIVLNTGSTLWTYQVYLTNSTYTNKLIGSSSVAPFSSNPTIVAVGFQNGMGAVQVSNFELTSSPVPEPATLGLVAVGGLGLLMLKRRKAV